MKIIHNPILKRISTVSNFASFFPKKPLHCFQDDLPKHQRKAKRTLHRQSEEQLTELLESVTGGQKGTALDQGRIKTYNKQMSGVRLIKCRFKQTYCQIHFV